MNQPGNRERTSVGAGSEMLVTLGLAGLDSQIAVGCRLLTDGKLKGRRDQAAPVGTQGGVYSNG